MQNGHYSHSHWDHHIWLLHSESSIVKSLNKGSSNQLRRIQKWMHEKIPDMLMHFWSKKSKKISFWKSLTNQFGINNSIHSTYLRKMVRQFWCKSLCFSCKIHSLKFLHASFPNHKRCGLCPLCFQTGMLLLWHIAYIGKAQRFCSVVFCCQMRFSFLKCLLSFTTLPLYNLICTFCAWFCLFMAQHIMWQFLWINKR